MIRIDALPSDSHPIRRDSRHYFRLADITGQSLPAFVCLFRIDVSWGDQHIVHKGRSPIFFFALSDSLDHKFFRPGGLPALAGRGIGLLLN
jgi:hypothetical protein